MKPNYTKLAEAIAVFTDALEGTGFHLKDFSNITAEPVLNPEGSYLPSIIIELVKPSIIIELVKDK